MMQKGFQKRILGKGWSAVMLVDSIFTMEFFILEKK
jgi:hypothetical protein